MARASSVTLLRGIPVLRQSLTEGALMPNSFATALVPPRQSISSVAVAMPNFRNSLF